MEVNVMPRVISRYECVFCKTSYSSITEAEECEERCCRIDKFNRFFPAVTSFPAQHDIQFYFNYKKALENLLVTNHPNLEECLPLDSYAMGRTLDDGNYREYSLLIRYLSICDKCFREYDQPYYARNCTHK